MYCVHEPQYIGIHKHLPSPSNAGCNPMSSSTTTNTKPMRLAGHRRSFFICNRMTLQRLFLTLSLAVVLCSQPGATISHVTPNGYYRCHDHCYDINSDCRCDQICDVNHPFYRLDTRCSKSFQNAPDQIIILSGANEYAGLYLPTSYIYRGREVYINEEKGLFMAWANYLWAIASTDHLPGAIAGQDFPALTRNYGRDSPVEGWDSLLAAAEAEATVKVVQAYGKYHPDNDQLLGYYHLTANVLNGRGVYVNDVTGRFLGYNGLEWVIADLATLDQALAWQGWHFSGFRKSNDELFGTFRERYDVGNVKGTDKGDYWVYAAEPAECETEEPYSAHGPNIVKKCVNKCSVTVWTGWYQTTPRCSDHAVCSRTPGGLSCECYEGYSGIGEECIEVDECAEGTHNCDANAVCTNTDGGFTCSCNGGWESSDEGVTCTNVDECAIDHSVKAVASSDCTGLESLTDGMESSGGLTECGIAPLLRQHPEYSDRLSSQWDAQAFVTLDLGSAVYLSSVRIVQYYEDSRTYARISVEVSDNQKDWESVFYCGSYWECGQSTEEGRLVSLPAPKQVRYVRVGSGRNSVNQGRGHFIEIKPEYVRHSCDPNAECTDTPGGYTCDCNAGYGGDGQTCVDGADECSEGTHNCDANAVCTNTDGSFTCSCNGGWESSDEGVTCTNVDECVAETPASVSEYISDDCRSLEIGPDYSYSLCGDSDTSPAFVTLDLGSAVFLSSVHILQYHSDNRQYQQVSVEVSADQENWESVFYCATFSECGYSKEGGRLVSLPTPKQVRFLRVGSGRNSLNAGRGHFINIQPHTVRHDCGPHAECVDTPGNYNCECDVGYNADNNGECVNVLDRRKMEVRAAAQRVRAAASV